MALQKSVHRVAHSSAAAGGIAPKYSSISLPNHARTLPLRELVRLDRGPLTARQIEWRKAEARPCSPKAGVSSGVNGSSRGGLTACSINDKLERRPFSPIHVS